MRFFRKKASLQLSINAIVILILAITILGLGLGFIRSQFGTLQTKFDEVGAQIENQLIEDIEKSGDLLSFNKLTFNGIKAGTPNEFFFGVKSTETSKETCFYVEFTCENAIRQKCPIGSGLTDLSKPQDNNPTRLSGWDWFSTLQGSRVASGDVKVIPAILQATNANSATYNGRVIIWKHTIESSSNPPASVDKCFQEPVDWPVSLNGGFINFKTGQNAFTKVDVVQHDSKEFFIDLV